MNYKIVIPSLGRAKILKERTLETLSSVSKDKIFIFVIKEEFELYKNELPDYNIIIGVLGCLEQKKFISSYFQEDEILLFLDDDIRGFYKLNGDILKAIHFEELINYSLDMLDWYQADLLGIYPIKNPYFMHDRVREGLAFCIGQFQLLRNRKQIFEKAECKILEDYERSLKYYLKYKTIRLDNITLNANYGTLKGGYQTESQLRTQDLKEIELNKFMELFSEYCFIKNKKLGKDLYFKRQFSKTRKVVNMLWIDLGNNDIFNVAIRSWLSKGFSINLYTNNLSMIDNSNVNHIDYKEILDVPIDNILQFSDLFRYKLLYDKGGLFVDADMVLLNDFDFSNKDYIISSEHTFQSGAFKSILNFVPNIGILKFPKGSPFLAEVIEKIENKDKLSDDECDNMKIFRKVLKKKKYSELRKYIKNPMFSCGLPWWDCEEAYEDKSVYSVKYNVMPPTASMILKSSCCVHLWCNFSNNKKKIDFKNIPSGSLFAKLKTLYYP